MRILHVIPSLDPGDGGPSKAVVEMARALLRAGLRVEIAATGNPPALPADVPVKLFPRRGSLEYKYSPELGKWLASHAHQYDLLHVHAVFNYSTHAAVRAARRAGVPYIIRPLGTLNPSYSLQQGTLRKRLYLSLTGKRELNRAAALHCTSQRERDDMRTLGLRAPAVVIPHGLWLDEFQDLPPKGSFRSAHHLPAGPPLIVFLGRIHPKKGFDLLFPALARIRERREFRLAIAGPGDEDYLASLRAAAEQHGLASWIVWPGMVSGEAKRALLADGDVFVLPSYNENFGIAVAEAMAAGVAVVTSDQVDLWPEVREWEAGLVTRCDPGEVAAALESLLADPERRARLGANGRRYAAARMNWSQVAERLSRLYTAARAGKVVEEFPG